MGSATFFLQLKKRESETDRSVGLSFLGWHQNSPKTVFFECPLRARLSGKSEAAQPSRLYGLVPNADLVPGKQQETKLGLEGLASHRRELRWTWKDGVGLDKQTW